MQRKMKIINTTYGNLGVFGKPTVKLISVVKLKSIKIGLGEIGLDEKQSKQCKK